MNKSMMVGALALLPAAVLADVTLYGMLQGSVGRNTISNSANNNAMNDNISLIGIKGKEPLGNGLKALWQVENRIHLDGNNALDTFGSRQTFVGVDGGQMGKIKIGYLNNAFNDNELNELYTVDQWQYADNINQSNTGDPSKNNGANGLGIFANPSNVLKNAIRYDTPVFGGFAANLVYSFGENKNTTQTINYASDIFSLGLSYHFGPYFTNYAFQREANPLGLTLNTPATIPSSYSSSAQPGSNTQTASIHYAEFGYKDEQLLLALGYQIATGYDWTDSFSSDSKANFGSSSAPLSSAQARVKTRQAALSAAYRTGPWKPKISYAKGWDQSANGAKRPSSGYRQYVFGVDYHLSKRTRTGLSYGRLTFDPNALAAVNQQTTVLTTTALTLSHSF